MKSQVATILTIAGLAAATGGAVGVASSSDPTGTQGGAASGQYVVTTTPVTPTAPSAAATSATAPSGAPATGGGSTSGVVDPALIGLGGAAVLAGLSLLGWSRRRRGTPGEG